VIWRQVGVKTAAPFLFTNQKRFPPKFYRLDLTTGARTLWKQLVLGDPAGVTTIGPILVTPDGKTFVYGFHRTLADQCLVGGLN
jgi:hypothetical protein